MGQIVRAAQGVRFVLVGESHTSASRSKFQADVIDALVQAGRKVVVGFEMFTRPNQANLAPWSLGRWTEEEFVQKADWQKQWGYPFDVYRPIFEVVREHKLPMVALNVDRTWVRAVGRGGPGALTAEQRAELPPLDLTNKRHRAVFDALMGGHPPTGPMGENMYAAQVLWDEGMADSALKAMAKQPSPRAVMVILAGSGHVMYGEGIGYRLQKQAGEKSLTLVCIDAPEQATVSRGLADFVFAAPPTEKAETKSDDGK